MIVFFRNIVILLLFFITATSRAQTENKSTKVAFKSIHKSDLKESNEIKTLYKLYNSGNEILAYKKAHKLAKTANLYKTKANANLLLAYYFNKQSVLDSVLFYTQKALQYNLSENDSLKTRLTSLSYNLMATVYNRKGLLSESKKYRIKGMEAAQKYNEQNLYFTHKHGLAVLYVKEQNYTKALALFKECAKFTQDPEMVFGSYINMGDIYAELKNYEASNAYYQKAEILCQQHHNNYCNAIVSLSIGDNFLIQKQINKALDSYQKASKITAVHHYQQLELTAQINIGKIYLSEKNYQDAKIIFTQSLQNAIALGLLQEQINLYEFLKEIALEQNEYKDAYHFSSNINHLKDSINNLQNRKEINELEIKFNTLQKEKAIKTLQYDNETAHLKLLNQEEAIKNLHLLKEITRKKNENKILNFQNITQKKQNEIALLTQQKQLKGLEIDQERTKKKAIIIIFSLLLLLILGLLFQYIKRLKTERLLHQKQKEISSQKLTTVLKEQELKLIKAAVKGQDKERKRIAQELHDSIGGNLAAIKIQLQALKLLENPTILPLLDETYDEVRNLSHNLIPKKFEHNPFCQVLEDYLKSICQASTLQLDLHMYPKNDINQLDEILQIELFKIIQELSTNTIKHAKATKIDIQLNIIEHSISLLFEDNGKGFQTSGLKKGIGLLNLESRISALLGNFEIDSNPKRGTLFNIEIPINTSLNKTLPLTI
ncbi:tetratricopeptide repeat-containing sensor histidine kinase [Flavobacterium agrisoli]|uniref:histidine kinase n=1 Tax=Flavobacterium agrisoli TaxID=2793066 RepID=A0A934PM09_9FLAO|nr:histidine kinase [Flavobacterium agrisoli]MBK0370646.1 histidine kinase [Flavobacterium agrisoli]